MPRPKSFDPDAVLAKAMGVFWEKGYDAASISDLTAAMGINRFSLYDTFGDKRELYLKTLDAYSENVVGPMVDRINGLQSLEELERLFYEVIEYQHSGECSPCCMMHRAAISLAAVDEEASKRVEQARQRIHGAFHDALERFQRDGELKAGLDLTQSAWLIMITKTGLTSYNGLPLPEEDSRGAVRSMIAQFRA